MPKSPDDIMIVGAGIAGLTASILLARAGRRVTVLEQQSADSASGYGIQITPNGSAVLRGLGAWPNGDALVADRMEICSRRSGAALCSQPFGSGAEGSLPHLLYHRSDLVDRLRRLAAEAGIELVFGAQVTRIECGGDSILCIRADGVVHTTPYLIAADGLHSPVRRMLQDSCARRRSKYQAWRALVQLPSRDKETANVIRLTPGPRGHLVTYPICGGTVLNVVAVKEMERALPQGLSRSVTQSELLDEFEKFAGVRDVFERCARFEAWTLPDPFVADNWFGRRIALIGDALHPMLPFLAQGGSMALEDAWLLSRFLLSCGTLAEAHARFRREREVRIRRTIRCTCLQGRLYHSVAVADPGRRLALRALNLLGPGILDKRMDWLVSHDATERR